MKKVTAVLHFNSPTILDISRAAFFYSNLPLNMDIICSVPSGSMSSLLLFENDKIKIAERDDTYTGIFKDDKLFLDSEFIIFADGHVVIPYGSAEKISELMTTGNPTIFLYSHPLKLKNEPANFDLNDMETDGIITKYVFFCFHRNFTRTKGFNYIQGASHLFQTAKESMRCTDISKEPYSIKTYYYEE